MKKFIYKLLLFFCLLVATDQFAGLVISYMRSEAKGGYTKHFSYICDSTCQDILVMGSSRAFRHYNPDIITDSLGMSCFNCGVDGAGILDNYCRWKMISLRYIPKKIIYEFHVDFDLYYDQDNMKYFNTMRAFYNREGVDSVYWAVDPLLKVKMASMMFRDNSHFPRAIMDAIHPSHVIPENGFLPECLDMPSDLLNRYLTKGYDCPIQKFDSLKLLYLEKLIQEVGSNRLVFVISPRCFGLDQACYQPIIDLCDKYNIPFYDFANDQRYIRNYQYFKDQIHLNCNGADVFSRDLAHRLKNDALN